MKNRLLHALWLSLKCTIVGVLMFAVMVAIVGSLLLLFNHLGCGDWLNAVLTLAVCCFVMLAILFYIDEKY